MFSGEREMNGWSVFVDNGLIQSPAHGFVHGGWSTFHACIAILDRNPNPAIEPHEVDVSTDFFLTDSSIDSVRPLD